MAEENLEEISTVAETLVERIGTEPVYEREKARDQADKLIEGLEDTLTGFQL